MDPEQQVTLPPGFQEALFPLHEEQFGNIQGMIKATHKTVVWDSGASISITFNHSDFVRPLEPILTHIKLQGIMQRIKIKGNGHVAWSFIDTTGMLHTVKLPALFVPSAKVHLLSTTSLLQTYPCETIELTEVRLLLSGSTTTQPPTNPVEVLINPATNLPTSMVYDHGDTDPSVFQVLL
jgi:hypothetical protein